MLTGGFDRLNLVRITGGVCQDRTPDTQAQFLIPGHFRIGLDVVAPGSEAVELSVGIGQNQQGVMHRGDAHPGCFVHEITDTALDLVHGEGRQHVLDEIPGGFPEGPAGLTGLGVLLDDAARRVGRVLGNTGHFDGL